MELTDRFLVHPLRWCHSEVSIGKRRTLFMVCSGRLKTKVKVLAGQLTGAPVCGEIMITDIEVSAPKSLDEGASCGSVARSGPFFANP
jgi:hypothetical protein